MQKFLTTLAVLTVIATPAFAQSFCTCDGTGNVVVLSTAIALSTAFTACAGDAAHSGTCAAQIAQLEQQIRGSGPTAPQSIEAQLHHQPTPRTVQNAESKAIADADAALQRAREPNARCKDSDRARSDSGFL